MLTGSILLVTSGTISGLSSNFNKCSHGQINIKASIMNKYLSSNFSKCSLRRLHPNLQSTSTVSVPTLVNAHVGQWFWWRWYLGCVSVPTLVNVQFCLMKLRKLKSASSLSSNFSKCSLVVRYHLYPRKAVIVSVPTSLNAHLDLIKPGNT